MREGEGDGEEEEGEESRVCDDCDVCVVTSLRLTRKGAWRWWLRRGGGGATGPRHRAAAGDDTTTATASIMALAVAFQGSGFRGAHRAKDGGKGWR